MTSNLTGRRCRLSKRSYSCQRAHAYIYTAALSRLPWKHALVEMCIYAQMEQFRFEGVIYYNLLLPPILKHHHYHQAAAAAASVVPCRVPCLHPTNTAQEKNSHGF